VLNRPHCIVRRPLAFVCGWVLLLLFSYRPCIICKEATVGEFVPVDSLHASRMGMVSTDNTAPVQGPSSVSIAREQLQWLNVSSRSQLSQLRRTTAPAVLCDFTGFRSGSLRLHSYGTRRGVTFHKNGDPNYGPPFCQLNSIHTNVLSLKTTSETQSLYARESYGLDRPGSESREV
jgi:hypothetical protein